LVSSLQDFHKLLDRVNVAKADTESVLQRIHSNTEELDDALDTLRGIQAHQQTGRHNDRQEDIPTDRKTYRQT